jgi:hypothetical protein
MKNLIKIRWIIIYRELSRAGWWACFVGLILYAGLIIKITNSSILPPSPNEFSFLFGLVVFALHSIRKDKRMLSIIFHEKVKLYYLSEYIIFSLPFILPFLFHKDFIGIFLFYISCLLIVFFDFSVNFNNKKQIVWLSRFIPKNNFEWIGGMRKNQYPIIVLYLFCVIISYWHFAGFICLGVITFCFSVFYEDCENQVVLTLQQSNSRDFIKDKLRKHSLQYFKFLSPIILIYILHYPDKWIFYLPLTVVYYSNYILYILNKYKSFVPNQTLRANFIYVGLTFLGMFIPYLFPISILLIFVFYPKSIQNLKPYFNA